MAAMYALSIGIQTDPMNEKDLAFTYENNEDFQVYPTNALTIAHRGPLELERLGEGIEDYNPMLMLHGDEQVIFHKPLEVGKTYVCSERVIDIKDKKKGCLVKSETSIRCKETKELYSTVRMGLFLRKLGGFGFKGKLKEKILKPPKREPDFVSEEET